MNKPQQIQYLTNRRYSIGVYADSMGYAITLLQINRVMIPYETNRNAFLNRSKQEYKEAIKYAMVKGILSADKSEVSIRRICTAIEVMCGSTENEPYKIYYNSSNTLSKVLNEQFYGAETHAININPIDSIFLINCLLNDGLLTITSESELLTRYNQALVDYTDPKEVNHALFSLALNLESFEAGDADWVKLLKNIEQAEYAIE